MTSYTIQAWSSSERKFHRVQFDHFHEAYAYAQEHGIGLNLIRPTENAVKISGVSNAALKRLEKAGVRFVPHATKSPFEVNNAVHVHMDDEAEALKVIGNRARIDLYTVSHQLYEVA